MEINIKDKIEKMSNYLYFGKTKIEAITIELEDFIKDYEDCREEDRQFILNGLFLKWKETSGDITTKNIQNVCKEWKENSVYMAQMCKLKLSCILSSKEISERYYGSIGKKLFLKRIY